MSLNANKVQSKGPSSTQPNLEDGSYPARVVQILDLGLQPQTAFEGKEKPPAYHINITYELLDEFCVDEDGNEQTDKPRWVGETMPMHSLKAERAKSTLRYKALDPNEDYDGDFTQLLGTPCIVTLVNNKRKDKVYTNVASVSAMRPKDASKAPELVNEACFFDLDDPDMGVFNKLPAWLQDKIKGNLEFEGSALQNALSTTSEPKPEPEADATKGEDDGQEDW